MIVVWHAGETMTGNRSCIVRIRTGETRAIANWRTALGVTGRGDEWEAALEWVHGLAEAGKDLTENEPVVDRAQFGGREIACVYGVLSNEITPQGRVFGEYRFIMCMADEVLLVLAKVFKIEMRLRRRAG